MKNLTVSVPDLCLLNPLIKAGTVNNNLFYYRKNGKDGWKHYSDEKDSRRTKIYYNTIPKDFVQKYGLPDSNVARDLLAEKKQQQTELIPTSTAHMTSNKDVADVISVLYHQKMSCYHDHYNAIKANYVLPVERCREFAQRIAVWGFIKANYNKKGTVWQEAYNAVFPDEPKTRHAFAVFLKRVQDTDNLQTLLIDQRMIKKAQKRISDFQYTFIKNLFVLPQKYGAKQVHQKLVLACADMKEKPYSLASVKTYMREFDRNVELYALRNGNQAAQKKLPFVTLLPALHRNTQWQMDGWTMPFWAGNFQRYTLYCIWDNHSRKIVGARVGKSEDSKLILDGLEDAIYRTGVLPAEMVSDAHSFTTTAIAKRFKEEAAKMGITWTVTTNAQRQQIAERYNQYFDPMCRDMHGYLGQNITAKGKNARISPERLQELRKTAQQLTENEILAIAAILVTEYNKTPLQPLEGMTANQKYDASESAKAIAINAEERANLLRGTEKYKVRRGQIIIKVGGRKHEFQLPAHLIDKYNDRDVLVSYEDLTQGIYIADVQTGEVMADIAPKQAIHGAIADQTERDKKLLNQHAGRMKGTVTKARKRELTDVTEMFKNNPDAIELLNHYSIPKDIRAAAMQDKEVRAYMRDMGGNEKNMPIRTTAATNVITRPAVKTKASPYTPANNVMEKINPFEMAIRKRKNDED